MSASKGEGERYEFPCNHRADLRHDHHPRRRERRDREQAVTFEDVNWGTGGDDDDE